GQLGAGEAPRRRRQRQEGRDRPGPRGVPGGMGPGPRRPHAARPRDRGVSLSGPRDEREGLRAQGGAGVPEMGTRVGGPRRRPRRAGGEGGGEGRLPEGARGGWPRAAGGRAEEAERPAMSGSNG